MKKLLFTLLVVMFSGLITQAQNKTKAKNKTTKETLKTKATVVNNLQTQAKIEISVLNKPTDSVYVLSQVKQNLIKADKNGLFVGNFEVNDGFHQLRVKDQFALIYLTNTSNLKINVDYKNFDNTLNISGNGAEENNFLFKFSKTVTAKFTDLLAANDQTELENGISKIKTDITNSIPTNVSKSFKESFNAMMDGQFAQIKEMAKQGIESKKMNGKPSPVFDYDNHKGGKTKLADLKGKLVYIDVWATWCGPCIGEIPSLKKVEAQYHNKNIEFVSISVDDLKDNEKWKNMVTKKELGGIQLFADNSWNSDFVKAYGINSIPRFILIGTNGEIINADAPRPSDPKLITLIDENLNKSK